MTRKIFGDKIKIADIILIAVLVVFSLSVSFITFLVGEGGAYAVVTVDGVQIARYSLDVDGEHVLNGGTNVLVIEGGYAYVRDASCKNQKCVKMGRVNRTGQFIYCEPNDVAIVIEGADDDMLEV